MQSTSAADGTYNLIVTFKIGTDLNFAQVLVQNRVSSALSQLPNAVQAQGVTVQKKSTAILMFVTLTSPDKSRDSLYPRQLRHHQSARRTVARVRRRQCQRVRRRTIFDAGLARPEQALCAFELTPQDVITALQIAEPAGDGRSGRHAAGAVGAGLPATPSTSPAGSARSSNTRMWWSRPARAPAASSSASRMSGASNSARRPTARSSRRTASRRRRSVSSRRPAPMRCRSRQAGRQADGRTRQGVSARHPYADPVRHHEIRECLDQRGLPHADRGRDPGADRDRGVPAGLARDAGAGDHGAGHDHRRLCRRWRCSASPSICRPCSRSCWRSASWSTTPSWWWRAPSHNIEQRHERATTPRSRRWTSCSARSSASRWC